MTLKNFLSIDIETTTPDQNNKDLALDSNRNIITKIAVFAKGNETGCYALESLGSVLAARDYQIVCHGGKFDFKTLIAKGAPLSVADYSHDTLSMAVAFPHKIPDAWLERYEAERKQLNTELGQNVHRKAGRYSLKTLAPYFLGVPKFWETANHDNEEYALKDAEYTYRLAQFFMAEMTDEQREFYDRLMRWSRMLLSAEIAGFQLDYDKLSAYESEYKIVERDAETRLKEEWRPHFEAYAELQKNEIEESYAEKCVIALEKIKEPNKEKVDKTIRRYDELKKKAMTKIEPFNLASPLQLKWLFKERMGEDITTFSGDEESTGKAVLERLAGEGVAGVETFLKWRKANKLNTAFFPSYRDNAYKGRLRTNFNISGTRTGRLSSSAINCQQVSKEILDIVCAPAGKKLIYRDVSAIEPRLIAFETECPELCKIFLDGSDFHSFNVRSMLGIQEEDEVIKTKYKKERDLLKEVGLALMYGAGAKRIQECAAKRGFKWSLKDCRQKYQAFAYTYQRVWEYKEALEASIKSGEIVTNVLGRPLHYDMERLHMQSLNTKIQSGGSDILLESVARALDMAAEEKLEFTPILFIHDSITVEVVDEQAEKVYDLLGRAISSWQFDTVYGTIPLISEGGVYQNLPAKG